MKRHPRSAPGTSGSGETLFRPDGWAPRLAGKGVQDAAFHALRRRLRDVPPNSLPLTTTTYHYRCSFATSIFNGKLSSNISVAARAS